MKVMPRPVRHAEGLGETGGEREQPESSEIQARLVLTGPHEEILGLATASSVGTNCWLRLVVHPDEREGLTELLQCALARIPTQNSSQILCTVRDYQGGLAAALSQSGFERTVERSLLVKHTTVQVSESRRKLVPALEKRAGVVPTLPQCQVTVADLE